MILATAPKLNKMNFSPLIKHNGKPIKRVSTSDYLGLIIDEKLLWQQCISSLKQKISSTLMALRQVAFLPEKSKIMLYHSLIESRLRNCNTVCNNCSSDLKYQLQRFQDRAARIITKGNNANNLLAHLGFLNIQQIIDFDMAVIVHKIHHNPTHCYFSGMFRKVNTMVCFALFCCI